MRPAAGATGRVFKSGKMIPMKTLPSSVPDSGPTSVPTSAPTSVSDSASAGRVAVVDVGSNASRLLVARGDDSVDGSGDGLAVEMFARVPLRLGAGAFVDGGGEIPAEGVRKLALVLRGFRNIIAAQAPDVSGAFATAALREAVNGKDVAQLMARRAGVAIEILSGRREAGVVGKFVAAQFPDARAMVCADVGGGSSDFVFAQNGTVKSAASFRVGTARPDDDKTAREFVRMEQWLSQLPPTPSHPPLPPPPPHPVRPTQPRIPFRTPTRIRMQPRPRFRTPTRIRSQPRSRFRTPNQTGTTHPRIRIQPRFRFRTPRRCRRGRGRANGGAVQRTHLAQPGIVAEKIASAFAANRRGAV